MHLSGLDREVGALAAGANLDHCYHMIDSSEIVSMGLPYRTPTPFKAYVERLRVVVSNGHQIVNPPRVEEI